MSPGFDQDLKENIRNVLEKVPLSSYIQTGWQTAALRPRRPESSMGAQAEGGGKACGGSVGLVLAPPASNR